MTLLIVSAHGLLGGETQPDARVDAAATVYEEVMVIPDKPIPQSLLDKAHCLVILPDLKKGAFSSERAMARAI